ncbi:fimbrial biogenesis outer membrane usher protein [Vibrio metschnikovii]|nr:fimbrial biogenesis outer membrane usher protein [Vibrio metschnikovii]
MFPDINKIKLTLLFFLFFSMEVYATERSFSFDSSLLLGSNDDNNLSNIIDNLLNESLAQEGQYSVDVYINNQFHRRELVSMVNKRNEVIPCFSVSYWKGLGVNDAYILTIDDEDCATVQDLTFDLNRSNLRLSLFVPQAYMVSLPRGYINPEQWDFGESALFINYDGNYFHSKQTSGLSNSENSSLFTGMRIGGNVGNWRFRSQLSYSNTDSGLRTQSDFNHIRTYAQTALPSWKSELTLGQTFTSDTVFDSVGFTGAELKSDIRMRPLSQRGFAPVITGVANSVATVTVSQQGRQIYQTTVSPGPFEIRDLYSTYYQGDLDVSIEEASGRVANFTVPFNAVSGSIRPGQFNYSVSVGQLRLTEISDEPYFIQGVYERGISNSLTTNFGMRVSENYFSSALGAVLGTPIGALGLRSIYSHADIYGNTYRGWRAGADYSIGFDTGTTLTLAGYRYSTSGYRTLSDVVAANSQNDTNTSIVFSQSERSLLSLNVNQSLANMGQLYFSGSHTSYRGEKDAVTQAQLGYSSRIGKATLNLNYSKIYQQDRSGSDDVVSLGISIPLGESNYPALMSLGVTRNDNMTSYQAGLSGQLDDLENTTYGLNYSLDDDNSTYSVSLNQLAEKASFGTTYSQSENYKQWGANIRGGAVIHSGGVNLSQSLGDSFAIVKAKDAKGVAIRNTRGAAISGNGYGIISNLSPYSINQISLDPSTINNKDVELSETQFRLIPTAGAILSYDVSTRLGKALLIQISGVTLPPLGSEIKDDDNINIGMVSQSGLAFIRVSKPVGSLYIRWGESEDQKCTFDYDISDKINSNIDLLRLSTTCK